MDEFTRDMLKKWGMEDRIPLFEEDISVRILFTLVSLFRVTPTIKQKSGIWRPLRIECQESFVTMVKVSGDVKPAIERRKNKAALLELPVQPCIYLVGESESSVESSYIAVDNVLYKLESPQFFYFMCGENKCSRSFNKLASFRSHLKFSHKLVLQAKPDVRFHCEPTCNSSSSGGLGVVDLKTNKTEEHLPLENVQLKNMSLDEYHKMFKTEIASFLANLYAKPSLTRGHVQSMIQILSGNTWQPMVVLAYS